MKSLAKKRYRSELSRIDWDFTGEHGSGGFAAYHWYPARFVPQLAGILIGYFSEPGDLVLDPFCGSGTTVVEAYKAGRRAIGIDLNPAAALMTQAKLTPFDERSFRAYLTRLRDELTRELSVGHGLSRDPAVAPDERLVANLSELRRWFHPETLTELLALWIILQRHRRNHYAPVGLTAFSAVLKYASSQEKHWGWVCDNVAPKTFVYRPAAARFFDKLQEFMICAQNMEQEIAQLGADRIDPSEMKVITGNCIDVLSTMTPNSVDLVVTSPPYYNMTDYVFSQRLTNLWFETDMKALRAREIGARSRRFRTSSRVEYLRDMREVMQRLAVLLKSRGYCCLVIGESPRHEPIIEDLAGICREEGFRMLERIERRVAAKRSLSASLEVESVFLMRRR